MRRAGVRLLSEGMELMGREIRKVPIGYEHPKDENGWYQPQHDRTFKEAVRDWLEHWSEYLDELPKAEYAPYYRPEWPKGAAMGFCVYENVTEGTPISPVFETEADLRAWLLKRHKDPVFVDAFIETRDGAAAQAKLYLAAIVEAASGGKGA